MHAIGISSVNGSDIWFYQTLPNELSGIPLVAGTSEYLVNNKNMEILFEVHVRENVTPKHRFSLVLLRPTVEQMLGFPRTRVIFLEFLANAMNISSISILNIEYIRLSPDNMTIVSFHNNSKDSELCDFNSFHSMLTKMTNTDGSLKDAFVLSMFPDYSVHSLTFERFEECADHPTSQLPTSMPAPSGEQIVLYFIVLFGASYGLAMLFYGCYICLSRQIDRAQKRSAGRIHKNYRRVATDHSEVSHLFMVF
eukprot:NP_508319.2 DystroGlycaN [Caenorhabditis elegans]